MPKYFEYFPKVTYREKLVTDITRRVKIKDDLLADPYTFLPYTIKEGERAEDVAYYYYGDQGKVWLIYLANKIIDPYTQWPMSNENVSRTIAKKYKAVSGQTTDDGVIFWSMSTTANNNIVHYQNNIDPSIAITPDTYIYNPSIAGSEWTPVRVYEYEMQLNEDRRNIYLINAAYANQVENDLEAVMNV
jgi:hypothetical protein